VRAFLSWISLYGIGLILGGALLLWRAVLEARRGPTGRHRPRAVGARQAVSARGAETLAEREATGVPVGIIDAPDVSLWPEPAWVEGRVRGQATVYLSSSDEALYAAPAGASDLPVGRITEPLDDLDELPEPQPTARPR
jgi:hypothetical protein